MIKKILILFIGFLLVPWIITRAEEITDLGETGFTCPLDTSKIEAGHTARINRIEDAYKLNIQPIQMAYTSNLPKHTGSPDTKHILRKENFYIPIGTKIFVFSCYDETSQRIAAGINASYGLCINFKSLNDLQTFRKTTGIKYPIQAGNEGFIQTLEITSYPALITINENEITIQEGF